MSACAYIPRTSVATLCFLLLAATLPPTFSSAGDRDWHYNDCLQRCTAECADPPTTANASTLPALPTAHVTPDNRLYAPPTHDPPLSLRLVGWSCESCCRYDCMWLHVEWRHSQQLPTVKYYGKWPFTRVLGMQELLSTLFSIGNLLPHAWGWLQYRRRVSLSYSMRSWWSAYALVACNTWLWSAVFHARDTLLTERLDYFCASLGIVVSFAVQLIRTFHIRSLTARYVVLALFLLPYTYHISYLHFVHFDYGYNMLVSLTTGIVYSLLCIATALYERRPYMSAVLLTHVYLWAVAAFEVWDFEPLLGSLLDAHAVWHGATTWMGWLFWRVQIEDAKWEVEWEKRRLVGSGVAADDVETDGRDLEALENSGRVNGNSKYR